MFLLVAWLIMGQLKNEISDSVALLLETSVELSAFLHDLQPLVSMADIVPSDAGNADSLSCFSTELRHDLHTLSDADPVLATRFSVLGLKANRIALGIYSSV